jgi:hypothetical protein
MTTTASTTGSAKTWYKTEKQKGENPMISDKWYKDEYIRLCRLYPDEINRLFAYEYCELESGFLGFLHVYAELNIPKDFTVIDLGCCQSVQASYFGEHAAYIGVDIGVPAEWCFRQDNAIYCHSSIQDFIQGTLPTLNLDLNKTVAICSYVPDEEAQQMVARTFPYHKVVYCDEIISEILP